MVVGSWPSALGVGGEAEGEGEYEWDEWFHCVFELDSCCLDIVLLSGVWASCSSKRELATWSEGVFFCLSGRGCERGGVDGYSSVSPSR